MRIPVHLLLTALRRCMLESDVCNIGEHEEMSPEGQQLDDMFGRLLVVYQSDDQVAGLPNSLTAFRLLMPKLGATAHEVALLMERVQNFHNAAIEGVRVGELPCTGNLHWWLIDPDTRMQIKNAQKREPCV